MAFLRYSLALVLLIAFSALPQVYAETPAPSAAGPALTEDEILDRIVAKEAQLIVELARHRPLVETYIQDIKDDAELGSVPKNDHYFLGKLDLGNGVNERSLIPSKGGIGKALASPFKQLYSFQFLPNGFAQMVLLDGRTFDRSHYAFEYVRREFLGEIRTLVFDVHPTSASNSTGFLGRIWVEDRDYSIVRFNGTYGGGTGSKIYFHFDSWREQMGPGLWLPAYVYTEESNIEYFMGMRSLRFKGQTRLWGYNSGRSSAQNEFTSLIVDADRLEDNGDAIEHMSPVLGQRLWVRQAEENMLQRMEKAGLLSPRGEVDEILETVVTNLEVTNNLTITPGTRARVLLTSPLESFTIGHTIVLSRGLIDVLPDEASLAMVLAHELAHIALGHRIDTKYAFGDRMLFDDTQSFGYLDVKRSQAEELAADRKAMQLLENSPYKGKLDGAGLFLRALRARASQIPSLLTPRLGNALADGKNVRMAGLINSAPKLETAKVDQTAALPIGGRLRLDPWSNRITLIKAAPVALLSAREKMPFEVTPVFVYLTRQKDKATASIATARTDE